MIFLKTDNKIMESHVHINTITENSNLIVFCLRQGNGKWKTSLGIYNVSQNDENTKIFWKAVNEAGKINGTLKLLIKRETTNHGKNNTFIKSITAILLIY